MATTTSSHFLAFVFVVQLFCGILFLLNRFIPLALLILAAVIVNILLFHITIAPNGIAPGLVATALWLLIAFGHRSTFSELRRASA